METYFLLGSIGILAITLIAGLVCGLIRGIKRSSLHIIFMLVSVVVAFLITKPIVNAVLGINIEVEGTAYTISSYIAELIKEAFDLSQYGAATAFIERLPSAIVSPILFMVLTSVCYFIFDMIYLIVARVSFGKKKEDFKKHKPNRWLGALVGVVEAFVFMFVLFAPITSLTQTYQEIVGVQEEVSTQSSESDKMLTIGEYISQNLPPEVNEAILCYNNSVIGKIVGVGGIDDAIFDNLAEIKVEGEKIDFRTELITLAKTYDEIAGVYNNITDNNFKNINLTNLKQNIETFLNNGIFKAVITDTVNQYITTLEEANLENAPEILKDALLELKTAFTAEGFDIYNYLKHDILKIVDTASSLFESGVIEAYQALENKEIFDILDLVGEKSEGVEEILNNVFDLNLVKDVFNTLGNFASEKIEEVFENDKGLEFGLNLNIEQKEEMIDDLLEAVNEFTTLNDMIEISSLLNASDIIDTLTEVDDIETVLSQIGSTFDTLKSLEILNLPVTETRLEKVSVFDNLLAYFNINLLGDDVYLSLMDVNPTKITTYQAFFDYIKTSIKTAKDLDLLEIGDAGVDFDTVLDKVLLALNIPGNEDLFAKILIPFYQLDTASFDTSKENNSIKNLVFDTMIDQLQDNVSLLSFDKVPDNLASWHEELTYIGKVMKKLNQGEVGDQNKTYIKYMLDSNADLEVVLKDMTQTDGKIQEILDPIFSAKVFSGLTETLFDEIDNAIAEITGVKTTTSLTNLASTKANVLEIVEQICKTVLNLESGESLSLQQIGQILDMLKTNAYNKGEKDGVFNNIFANIIWYMTGDDITASETFTGKTPNENAKDVKAYLNISSADNFVGYYTVESYEQIMIEIDEAVEFASTLADNLAGITLADETITEYVSKVKETLDTLENKTEAEKVEIIENLKTLIDGNAEREDILTEEDKTNYSEKIVSAIDHVDSGISAEVGEALKKLLEINA